MNPELVAAIRSRFPEITVHEGSLLETPIVESDWIVCCGTFGFNSMNRDLPERIVKCWESCRKGLLFNLLSTWAGPEHIDGYPESSFNSPEQVLAFCFTMTKKIRLDHSYMPHDFTVQMLR